MPGTSRSGSPGSERRGRAARRTSGRVLVPASAPSIGDRERALVDRALREGWISSRGPYVDAFEGRFARWVGVPHGVATTSGTTALHLALAALGVGPGDEVIVPDFTMVACVDAVLYTGATPVFADVDADSWTIDPAEVERLATPRTRAVMPVHLYGHPADMDPIREVARARRFAIVEDAAEAHGSTYRGRRVGALGTVGCFSFYSNKLLTTGEGGMLVTAQGGLAERARSLRDLAFATRERDYRHSSVGFNYRLTNIQAAIGLGQLARLPESIRHRVRCARIYAEVLAGVPGIALPMVAGWAHSVFWMYTVRVLGGAKARERLVREMRRRGVESRVGFWPLHRQPFCARYGRPGQRWPVSTRLGLETLSLPSGNGISEEQVRIAAAAARDSLRASLSR
jgi:perosamine synthetase